MGTIVGVVVGVTGTVFRFCIEWATGLRQEHLWLLLLLPAAGLLITWLYQVTDMGRDKGTNFILIAVRTDWRLRARTAPLIFVSTVLTHLCGGSAGREGAALQLGGCMATWIGHLLRLSHRDQRIMTMCGMAAGFAALFGTPIASAVFAMEVVTMGVMYYSAIVPCVLAALIAHHIGELMGLAEAGYVVTGIPDVSVLSIVQIVVLGALFAVVARLFCFVTLRTAGFLQKQIPNPYFRAAAGGGAVVALTLLMGTTDYNGTSSGLIAAAIAGTALPLAFLLKIVFTALTLGSGYKGGEIVPAFVTGATFGCVAAPLLGLSPSFGAALGMVAVFCGVTNSPLASILLAYELFGGQHLALFVLGCAVSYLLSGYSSLYGGQDVGYSKFLPDTIEKARKTGDDE